MLHPAERLVTWFLGYSEAGGCANVLHPGERWKVYLMSLVYEYVLAFCFRICRFAPFVSYLIFFSFFGLSFPAREIRWLLYLVAFGGRDA